MDETGFVLDRQLEKDTIVLGDFPLSRVLLMNDRQYPWLILVPCRPSIREHYQLSCQDQQQLWAESAGLGRVLMELFAGHKLNVAALGNIVSQLHLHHIVRYPHDIAWPKPVWGYRPAVPYSITELSVQKEKISKALTVLDIAFLGHSC